MHIMLCRNQSEMSHTCRGTINLANSLIQPGDSCNIVISHGGTRTFHLKATSEVERQRWVTSLELSKARAISIAESGIVIAVCIFGTSLRVGALLVTTTTTTNCLCFIDHFQMNLSQHGTGTRSSCCFTILHNLGLLVSPFFFLHFCFRRETFEIGDTSFSQARCLLDTQPRYQSLEGNLEQWLHTHTRLTALCPGLPGWAGTRKVQAIWILLKQETVSGSGISWAICKSAPRCRQITMPAPHHSSFFTGHMLFLPPNQQHQSTEGSGFNERKLQKAQLMLVIHFCCAPLC